MLSRGRQQRATGQSPEPPARRAFDHPGVLQCRQSPRRHLRLGGSSCDASTPVGVGPERAHRPDVRAPPLEINFRVHGQVIEALQRSAGPFHDREDVVDGLVVDIHRKMPSNRAASCRFRPEAVATDPDRNMTAVERWRRHHDVVDNEMASMPHQLTPPEADEQVGTLIEDVSEDLRITGLSEGRELPPSVAAGSEPKSQASEAQAIQRDRFRAPARRCAGGATA